MTIAPSNQTHRPLATGRGAGSSHALAMSISASGTMYFLFTALYPLRLFCQQGSGKV
ncbi:hypothetical protein [Klebsiella pneumoniae]|uniref:hypothetical protein n=1 Tax=Klebsiella pneumoniae TaxID=573 RepID=UPI0015D5323F|nr:hypothetical protein [Klebsiella pneumoniae]HDU4325351.1 hypothetical protein [Klebsiella pneumoniae subsp. pneumoniae]MBD7161927.1 hypothetical protein [Klebsiella pneumoniae]MCW8509638.1 hypothetical protein [Klebsiella pneumoniae]HBR1756741.1 hypothetical protein [Klebsiella pneumoniae]HBW7648516.1 hypothetical protein [Klebsiella pneumoniae]